MFGHTDTSCQTAFSPDGRLLASVSGSNFVSQFDPGVRIWDVATGRPLRRFKWPPNGAHGVAFLPDGRAIVTVGDDDTVLVWDISDLADRRPSEAPGAGRSKPSGPSWPRETPRGRTGLRGPWASPAPCRSSAIGSARLQRRPRPGSVGHRARSPTPRPCGRSARSPRSSAFGDPPAREVLERIARGVPDAPATRDAADALIRLARRGPPPDRRTLAMTWTNCRHWRMRWRHYILRLASIAAAHANAAGCTGPDRHSRRSILSGGFTMRRAFRVLGLILMAGVTSPARAEAPGLPGEWRTTLGTVTLRLTGTH